MVICLERGADGLHIVQQMPLPPHHRLLQQNPEWFILLVPAYPGCPGKKAAKRLCVCVCVVVLRGKLLQVFRARCNFCCPTSSGYARVSLSVLRESEPTRDQTRD